MSLAMVASPVEGEDGEDGEVKAATQKSDGIIGRGAGLLEECAGAAERQLGESRGPCYTNGLYGNPSVELNLKRFTCTRS